MSGAASLLPVVPPIADSLAVLHPQGQVAPPPLAAVPGLSSVQGAQDWTFDSSHLAAEPGVYTLVKGLADDFEIQATRSAGPSGTLTARVAIKANAAGTVVVYNAQDQELTVNGRPTLPPRGNAVALPGDGSVTNWGRGFITVDSAAGDSVSIFARGGNLDFSGALAPARNGAAYGQLGAFGIAPPTAGALLMADGSETTDPAAFGKSWQVGPEGGLEAPRPDRTP